LAQLLANGLGKGDVRDDAAAKKRVLEVALGAVKELVGQDDVPLDEQTTWVADR